jgi:hypothetical protein
VTGCFPTASGFTGWAIARTACTASGPAASVCSRATIWLSLKRLLSAAAAAPDLQSTKPAPLEAEAVENNKFDSARFEPLPFEQSGPVPGNLDIRLAAEEVNRCELPFRNGRAATGEGKDTDGDIHLAIEDDRPFNLLRRHFSIEEEAGALVARDCGSYHGTALNGQILGGEGLPLSAPLMTGESELVAGRSDSPFRFRILVR